MKIKLSFIFFLVFLIVVLSLASVFSWDISSISLNNGKNILKFNSSEPFYVKTLMKLNPDIEAVSYNENNETIGYVNIFGGIGENFIMQEGVEYEIIARGNLSLVLPYEEER